MQKKYLLKRIMFIIIIFIIADCLNSTAFIITNSKITDSCDIPTWYKGDKWVYNINPLNYDGENGSFFGKIENLKYEVAGITSIVYNDEEIEVYQMDITGEISGDIEWEIVSGYLEGEIEGVSYVRVSDHAEVKTEIISSGTVQVLIIYRDYEMVSSDLFFPPLELYDFPINVDDIWYISSRTNSTGYFTIEGLIDEDLSGDSWSNQTLQCIGKENINVPAGIFDCFKIEQTNSVVWYSPEVGNNIKSEIDQSNENTTLYMVLSLESYSLVNQPIIMTEDINPALAVEDQKVVISGLAIDLITGNPIKKGDIDIVLPVTDDIWSTSTDDNGFYTYTINAPLIFDDTPTYDEFGSDGVIVKCSLNNLRGYIIKTLTIKENYPPNAPVINGPNNGKKNVEIIYEFNSFDVDADDLYYYVEWGDGVNTSWIGPYKAGQIITLKHKWNENKNYQIRAKAKDLDEVESSWTVFDVSIVRNRIIFNSLLENMSFRLQDYFPILKILF